MERTTKKLLSMLLTLILLLSCVGCAGKESTGKAKNEGTGTEDQQVETPAGDESEQVLIGVCCDLTGPNSLAGVTIANAVKLAAKQINEQGGILGKEVVLEIVDDQTQADVCINAIQKLCANEDLVAIAGGLIFTGMVLAIENIVEQYHIPTLVGGSSPSINDTNNPWLFRVRVSDTVTTNLTCEYIDKQTDFNTWGEIYATTDYGTTRNKLMTAYCEENDIPFHAVSGNVGDKDWTAQILELKNKGCDVVCLDLDVTEMTIIVQQMASLGYLPQVFMPSTAASKEFLGVVPQEVTNGMIYVGESALDSTMDGFQEFRQAYIDEYGEEPHPSAQCMYPTLWILKDAMERANTTTDKEAIRVALTETENLPTTLGPMTYDKELGVNMNSTLLFCRIENGAGVCFDSITAK